MTFPPAELLPLLRFYSLQCVSRTPPPCRHALTCRGRALPRQCYITPPRRSVLSSSSRRVGLGSSAPAAHPAARHQAEHLVARRSEVPHAAAAARRFWLSAPRLRILQPSAATAHPNGRLRPVALRLSALWVRFPRLSGSRLNALRLRILRSGGLARRLAAALPVVRQPGGCGFCGSWLSAPRLRILRPGGLRPDALRLSALWVRFLGSTVRSSTPRG